MPERDVFANIGKKQGFGPNHERTDSLDPIKAMSADNLSVRPIDIFVGRALYAYTHPYATGRLHGAYLSQRKYMNEHGGLSKKENKWLKTVLRLEMGKADDPLDRAANLSSTPIFAISSALMGRPEAFPILEIAHRVPTYLLGVFEGIATNNTP